MGKGGFEDVRRFCCNRDMVDVTGKDMYGCGGLFGVGFLWLYGRTIWLQVCLRSISSRRSRRYFWVLPTTQVMQY